MFVTVLMGGIEAVALCALFQDLANPIRASLH